MINKENIELDLKIKIADTINDFFIEKIQNTQVSLNKNSYLKDISELINLRDEIITKWGDNLQ